MIRSLALATALLTGALAACGGTTGTVQVSLVTAPDSHVLDAVQKLRLTLSDPRQVVEAERTSAGFALALEFDAADAPGALVVEGFDASGALVACGQTPAFPLSAIDAAVTVYLAAPNSVARAPVALTTARSDIAGAALGFGAVLAGGRDSNDTPTTNLEIYNAFNHSLASGLPLPAARTGAALTTVNSLVLMFGGTGADGNDTGTLWQFDTAVAPSGAYTTLVDQADFRRSHQLVVPVVNVGYAITGAPPLVFDGATLKLTARDEVPALPAVGGGGITGAAVFVGDSIIQFANNTFTTLAAPGRAAPSAATRPDGHVIVVGGSALGDGAPLTRDALDINPATGAITTVADALSVGRVHPAIAATARHVVVAGGTDATGAVIASADILDATTLAPIATVPIEPRTGAVALALPNDQILLAGGAPASTTIELFTPPPPTLP